MAPPQQVEMTQSFIPKVSVIVPNYNHARFLTKRLESVLTQTFQEFELLIMDDKSADDSLEIIKPYLSDPRVRLELNQENSGSPYKQWRKGLAMTRGEYIWIAESDDWADSNMLETLVDALDSDPQIGIASCLSYEVDGNGNITHHYFDEWMQDRGLFSTYGPFPFRQPLTMQGRDYCAHYMSPFNTLPNASGMLFRRVALEAIGGPVDNMKICGDWFTYCKILMSWKITIQPESFNYFRSHTTNVRLRTTALDYVREAQEVRSFLRRQLNNKPLNAAWELAYTLDALRLISTERTRADSRVPLQRFPALIGKAIPFGAMTTARMMRLLAHEVFLDCRKQLQIGKIK